MGLVEEIKGNRAVAKPKSLGGLVLKAVHKAYHKAVRLAIRLAVRLEEAQAGRGERTAPGRLK